MLRCARDGAIAPDPEGRDQRRLGCCAHFDAIAAFLHHRAVKVLPLRLGGDLEELIGERFRIAVRGKHYRHAVR